MSILQCDENHIPDNCKANKKQQQVKWWGSAVHKCCLWCLVIYGCLSPMSCSCQFIVRSGHLSILNQTLVWRQCTHLHQVMESGLLAHHFEGGLGGPTPLTLWQVTHHHLNPTINGGRGPCQNRCVWRPTLSTNHVFSPRLLQDMNTASNDEGTGYP